MVQERNRELSNECGLMVGIITSTYGKDTHMVIESYRINWKGKRKGGGKMIKYEILENSIRYVTPISIFYIPEDQFLEFQQVLKNSLFDFYKAHPNKKLGQKTSTEK